MLDFRCNVSATLLLAALAPIAVSTPARAQVGAGFSNAERMILLNRGLSNRNAQRYFFISPTLSPPQFQQQQLYRQRLAQQRALDERRRLQSTLTRPRTDTYVPARRTTPVPEPPAMPQTPPLQGPVEPELPAEVQATWEIFGVLLHNADADAVRQAAPQYRAGMEVLGVSAGGPADKAGWKPGDILIAMGRYRTENQDHVAYVAQMPSTLRGEPISALIVRNSEVFSSELMPEERTLPRD